MEKVVGYRTLAGTSSEELDNQVIKLIDEGFQPFGSPFINENKHYQAMVLTEKEATRRSTEKNPGTFTPHAFSG